MGQLQIKSKLKEEYNMPVMHYAELLSIALGIDPEELSLNSLKIKVEGILNKI